MLPSNRKKKWVGVLHDSPRIRRDGAGRRWAGSWPPDRPWTCASPGPSCPRPTEESLPGTRALPGLPLGPLGLRGPRLAAQHQECRTERWADPRRYRRPGRWGLHRCPPSRDDHRADAGWVQPARRVRGHGRLPWLRPSRYPHWRCRPLVRPPVQASGRRALAPTAKCLRRTRRRPPTGSRWN